MKHKTSGQLIRVFRERAGFSQEELAEIIEVSTIKLSHWEDDETAPRPAMIGGLSGALGLSSEEIEQLEAAAAAARSAKRQTRAEVQAVVDAEVERLNHKGKALRLLWLGVIGFAGGFIFALARGTLQELWYFPFAIGAMLAGLPYGWSVLTSKDEPRHQEGYTYDPKWNRTNLFIQIAFYVLKFIAAYFVGVCAYPIVLFYHAYKAGRKGSVFKGLMLVALILVVTFAAIIAGGVIIASVGR